MFAVIFLCGDLFLRIAGKIAKISKIRTRKNFVPHGISQLVSNNFICKNTLNYQPTDLILRLFWKPNKIDSSFHIMQAIVFKSLIPAG